jgi:hypothetical protein
MGKKRKMKNNSQNKSNPQFPTTPSESTIEYTPQDPTFEPNIEQEDTMTNEPEITQLEPIPDTKIESTSNETRILEFLNTTGICSIERIACNFMMDRKQIISILSEMNRRGVVQFGIKYR